MIELDRTEKDEGLKLLLHSSQADGTDVAVIEKILARIENLPLVIDQVRAYISKQRLRLEDFESEYERQKENFMKETPRIWQYRRACNIVSVGNLDGEDFPRSRHQSETTSGHHGIAKSVSHSHGPMLIPTPSVEDGLPPSLLLQGADDIALRILTMTKRTTPTDIPLIPILTISREFERENDPLMIP